MHCRARIAAVCVFVTKPLQQMDAMVNTKAEQDCTDERGENIEVTEDVVGGRKSP